MSHRPSGAGLLVVLSAGCNSLLDLQPGTLADTLAPSCAAGWRRRIPIDIDNVTGSVLSDYPVAVPVDVGDTTSLRFTLNEQTPALPFELDRALPGAWVGIPELPPGTTRLYAYHDNPDAEPWPGPSPLDSDLIANPSFETAGGWTINQAGANVGFSTAWSSDGMSSLLVDAYRGHDSLTATSYGVTQRVRFPAGTDYVLRFDLSVLAASNSGLNSSGEFFVSVGDGLFEAWRKSGDDGNITGVYRDLETIPFGAGDAGIMLGVTLRDGFSASYAKGHFDHVRVRKHVTPTPTVSVGADEGACSR